VWWEKFSIIFLNFNLSFIEMKEFEAKQYSKKKIKIKVTQLRIPKKIAQYFLVKNVCVHGLGAHEG
jgi:hypothetical protein